MLVLYLLALCCYEGHSVVIDIPEDIGNLCPYSDICNRSATADLNNVGKRPCCQECSCDNSCWLRLNCCFEEYDTYKLVERGLVACIAPFEGNPRLINMHSSFYMIQACYDNGMSINKLCNTRDEQGNSLIAPVSSTNTGYIYINDECAKCNGLADTKAWKAFFLYDSFERPTFNHLDFRDSIFENTSTLVYKPPAEENWYKQQCFENNYSYFDYDSSCNNSVLSDVCTNLNSPYTDILQRVYKNIYCTRCRTEIEHVEFECKKYSDGRGSFAGLLTMLMDVEAISNLKQKANEESSPSLGGEGCVHEFGTTLQDECVHAYCPEGQTETPEGCKYLGLWWYTTFFLMQVKLVPLGNERPSVSSLLQIPVTERSRPFTWIRPPCKELNLTEMAVYYESIVNSTKTEHVKSLIVVFGRTTFDSNGIDPSVVIPQMKHCIDKTWRLRINGTPYLFSASFDKYLDYVQDGQQLKKIYSVERYKFISQNEPDPAVFKLISSKMNNNIKRDFSTNRGGLWLRKSFYCEQVRLSVDEVELGYEKIKILSKNITLGSNKFTFISNTITDEHDIVIKTTFSFFVCLDDYLSANTSHGTCQKQCDFMIMLCTIISWHFVFITKLVF